MAKHRHCMKKFILRNEAWFPESRRFKALAMAQACSSEPLIPEE